MGAIFTDETSNYPPKRVFVNDVVVEEQDITITAETANNPMLLLAQLYGQQATQYADIFFAINHITDPYTQLPKGKVVHKVSKERAIDVTNQNDNDSDMQRTMKVKHVVSKDNKITF